MTWRSVVVHKPATLAYRRTAALAASLVALVAVAALARQATGEDDEKKVRLAAFRYYSGMVLGDADLCAGSVAFPLHTVRNGSGTQRDEKALRALVTEIAKRSKSADLTADQRKQVLSNMLAVFDSAAIQFVGGDTAAVTFAVKPAATRESGDVLAHLVLHRSSAKWRVIAEFTDSKPTPVFADPINPP
ncbi:MAG: hypothetical protein FJX72_03745 [Armatimonadetes bacterium]|nr:hypothetical protein [Armatimonadota bacterium]